MKIATALLVLLALIVVSGCAPTENVNDEPVVQVEQDATSEPQAEQEPTEEPEELTFEKKGAIRVELQGFPYDEVASVEVDVSQLRLTDSEGKSIKPYQSVNKLTIDSTPQVVIATMVDSGQYDNMKIYFTPEQVRFTEGGKESLFARSGFVEVTENVTIADDKTLVVTIKMDFEKVTFKDTQSERWFFDALASDTTLSLEDEIKLS